MNLKQIKQKLYENRLRISYGINYLDIILKGVFSNELVIIGARSGSGKSTIASNIAKKNSREGKKVVLFSLENDEGSTFLEEVYKHYKALSAIKLSLREFLKDYSLLDNELLQNSIDRAKETFQNIHLVERKPEGFNIRDMADSMVKLSREYHPDVFIIDHIDYFDMHNPNANENQNISEIMKEIRAIQGVYGIPVILISHLKKGVRDSIVPTLEDFFGTSNKVKEATTVILFAPDDETNSHEPSDIKNTWVCIRKDRFGGYKNTVANIGFDTRINEYRKWYDLYSINYWGDKVEKIEQKEEVSYEM